MLSVSCAVAVLAGLGAGGAAAAPADWKRTDTPEISPEYTLNGMATHKNDVWAVGSVIDNVWSGTVALHWNGKKWARKPTPKGFALLDATATSGSDVWAVGIESDTSTLIAKWDGKKWKKVPSPTPSDLPSNASPKLTSVTGSADDLWAVGCAENDHLTNGVGMLQHWDGKEWKAAELPKPDGANYVCPRTVNTLGDRTWAVGYIGTDDGNKPFAMRLDNGKWQLVPMTGGKAKSKFTAVTTLVEDGTSYVVSSGLTQEVPNDPTTLSPLIQRWDGKKWTEMSHPLENRKGLLYGASVGGPNPWVGGYGTYGDPYLLHWDGKAWQERASGVPEHSAIVALEKWQGGTVWAIGHDGKHQGLLAKTP